MTHLRLARPLVALALAVVLLEPFLFWGMFAGDAEVHLVFSESAAAGRFFQFNPGEATSGETSPGYMLLGAALFRSMPAAYVPVAFKVLGLLAWYALCVTVYLVGRRLFAEGSAEPERRAAPVAALVAALVAAAVPGSVYDANVGMENGVFAALVWGWILVAHREAWFEAPSLGWRRELLMGAWLGASCWLRPEAVIVAAAAYGVRLWSSRWRDLRWIPGALVGAAIAAGAFALEFAYTGDLIPTSMRSRRVLALPHLVGTAKLAIDPTFAKRLLAYLPLTAFFVAFVVSERRRLRAVDRFLVVVVAASFVVYTLAGAPHLGRYLIFVMPALALGAVRGALAVWRRGSSPARALVLLAALALVATDVVETAYRARAYSHEELRAAMDAPATRAAATEQLLDQLRRPAARPVIVADESVQLRYFVDDRILVRSLDGRVDRALLEFVGDTSVDHLGYLRRRGVQYLLQTPDYNRDRTAWSLAALATLPPGGATEVGGMAFRRIGGSEIYAVSAGPSRRD